MKSLKYAIVALLRGVGILFFVSQLIIRLQCMRLWYGHSEELILRYRRKFSKGAVKILGIRIHEAKTVDLPEVALYVSNHRTLTDPIIQSVFIDTYIVAKAEVAKIPILGNGAALTGIIFVQRDQKSSRASTLLKIEECLLQGKSILIYPEGTTTGDVATQAFRHTTFRIAARHNIPVVPMALEYRDPKDYWTKNGLIKQAIDQCGAWYTHTKLRIGNPVRSSEGKVLLEESQKWIDEQLVEMQHDWSRIFKE